VSAAARNDGGAANRTKLPAIDDARVRVLARGDEIHSPPPTVALSTVPRHNANRQHAISAGGFRMTTSLRNGEFDGRILKFFL
jgi:hypothetical protein